MKSNTRSHFVSLVICINIGKRFISFRHYHNWLWTFQFLSKAFEIVLENIDQFVRLQCRFYSRSYYIEEVINVFKELIFNIQVFVLVNEVFWIILTRKVDHSIIVSLRLKLLKLSGSLQTYIEYLYVKHSGLQVFRFLFRISSFSSISLYQISVLWNKFSLFRESHFNERSGLLKLHFLDFSLSCLHKVWFIRLGNKHFRNKISFFIFISLRSFISEFSLRAFFWELRKLPSWAKSASPSSDIANKFI